MQSATNNMIWVIEEDEDEVVLLRSIIAQCYPGFKLVSFPHGYSLLKQLDTCPDYFPKIILLNTRLAAISGKELLVKMRSMPGFSKTAIFMMSVFLSEREEYDLMAEGAQGVFIKPNTFTEMQKEVEKIVYAHMPIRQSVLANGHFKSETEKTYFPLPLVG